EFLPQAPVRLLHRVAQDPALCQLRVPRAGACPERHSRRTQPRVRRAARVPDHILFARARGAQRRVARLAAHADGIADLLPGEQRRLRHRSAAICPGRHRRHLEAAGGVAGAGSPRTGPDPPEKRLPLASTIESPNPTSPARYAVPAAARKVLSRSVTACGGRFQSFDTAAQCSLWLVSVLEKELS